MSWPKASPTNSCVVRSTTPANTPASISSSMAEPPAPEAWNATASQPRSRNSSCTPATAPCVWPSGRHHGCHGGGGRFQNGAADPIRPAEQIADGEEHRHVLVAEVGPKVAGCHGRDDYLRDAQG